MQRSLAVLGLLAALALLLAACGGDDTLSVEAYFEALQEVDADAEARGGAAKDAALQALADADPTDSDGATAAFFDPLEKSTRAFRADLAALTAPAEVAAAHTALVDATDAVIDEIDKVRARGGDAAFVDLVAFLTDAGDANDEVLRACIALEQLAADRDIDLVLACAGGGTLSDKTYFKGIADAGADFDERAAALSFESDGPPDAETVAAVVDDFRALLVDNRAAWAALTAPSYAGPAHEALLAAMDAAIDVIETARQRVEAGEDVAVTFPDQVAAFDEINRACAALQQLAVDRGVNVDLDCAE